MPLINLGNVVGIVRSEVTPPGKKYVLWGKIINPSFPDLVELHYWDDTAGAWVSLTDPTHQYWLRPVIDNEITVPPVTPTAGDRYLIPVGASGAWSGKTDQVATYKSGTWVFTVPLDGYYISVRTKANTLFDYRGLYGAGGVWVESDFNVPIAPGTYIPSTEKDAALGVAVLDSSSKIKLSYILHNDIPYEPSTPLNWPAGTDTIKKALDNLVLRFAGGGDTNYMGTWDWAANGNAEPAWVAGNYGEGVGERFTPEDVGYVPAGALMFKMTTGFKYY